MIANILVLLFLVLMAYWWGSVQGFFSAFIHLVITIVAGSLAIALWEPIVMGLLINSMPEYAWGVGLLVPFVVLLIVLRVAADKLVKANLQFKQAVNSLAGGLCGLLAGVLASGLTVIGAGFLPLDHDAGGYQPYAVDHAGAVISSGSGLWVPVDRHAAAFFTFLSGGSFFSGYPLGQYQPELAMQASLFRMRIDSNSGVSASPESVQVTNQYALSLPVQGLEEELIGVLGTKAQQPRTKIVAVDTAWSILGGAYDSDSTLRVPPSQIRLIGHDRQPGESKTYIHAPVGYTTSDSDSSQRRFRPFNSPRASAYASRQSQTLTWVFLVPEEHATDYLLVRHLRLKTPKAQDDPAALIAAVGRWSDPQDTELAINGGTAAGGGTDDGLPDPVLDARLPITISKNLATGLNYESKSSTIIDGSAEVRRPSGRIGKGSRVERIHVPKHLAAVRVRFIRTQARSLLGSVVTSAEMLEGVWLEDDRGDKWLPVGYVWKKADGTQQISIDRDNMIRSVKQIPVAEMRSGDEMYLYFVVARGVNISACHYGSKHTKRLKLNIPS